MTAPQFATIDTVATTRAVNAADPRVVLTIEALRIEPSCTVARSHDIRDQFATTQSKGGGARVNSYANRKSSGMVKVGSVPSNLDSTHGKEIAVWRGVGIVVSEGAA